MSNETNNTSLDYIIPELWSEDVLAYLYQNAQVIDRVTHVDGDVQAFGDILHLPALPSVSVNSVGADGSLTNQNLTLTEAQLVVNNWKEATVEIVDKASIQAKVNIMDAFKREFPRALKDKMETDILALYSDVATNPGGDNLQQFNEDLALAAIQHLLDAKNDLSDPNEVSFVLHTSQYPSVKKVNVWNNAYQTGESVGGAIKREVPMIYGVPCFFNANVASSGGARQNLLFKREAFAIGIQRNIQIEQLARIALTRRVTAHCLYGVKTRLETRACLIKTKA